MIYKKEVILKDGTPCLIRSAGKEDAQAVYDCFMLTHEETDWLLSYADENSFTVEGEGEFLARQEASDGAVELCAVADGHLAGLAGIEPIGPKYKVKHRADFGISIERAYWGKGMGWQLTQACIECARKAGYLPLELEAVSENAAAIALYEKAGFREYGRNPKGFRTRDGRWQELVLMRLEL